MCMCTPAMPLWGQSTHIPGGEVKISPYSPKWVLGSHRNPMLKPIRASAGGGHFPSGFSRGRWALGLHI